MSTLSFSTNFANLCWTQAEIWVIYYVYYQNSISITGCHGNDYILYSLNDFFLENIFFLIWLVQVTKLAPIRNSPGGAR